MKLVYSPMNDEYFFHVKPRLINSHNAIDLIRTRIFLLPRNELLRVITVFILKGNKINSLHLVNFHRFQGSEPSITPNKCKCPCNFPTLGVPQALRGCLFVLNHRY